MDSLEPLINVVAVLTILSIMAERATNLIKLGSPKLRCAHEHDGASKEGEPSSAQEEKAREYAITGWAIGMGVAIALLLKADIFAILGNMQEPWKTLGWVHVDNYKWVRSAALATPRGLGYATAGCLLTGVALGFGSKFWHDVLGSVREVKNIAKKKSDA